MAGWVLDEGTELELLDDDEELAGGVDTTGAAAAWWIGRGRALRFLVAFRRGCSRADLLCRMRSPPPAPNGFASVGKIVAEASGEISAAVVIVPA